MASSCNVVAILVMGLVSQGFCCSLEDIVIGTVRTGVEIQGKPEWKVTVTNNSKCAQHELRVTCQGFQTVEAVDPSIFKQEGDKCLVNHGNALNGFGSVSFSYPFIMFPSSSVVEDC